MHQLLFRLLFGKNGFAICGKPMVLAFTVATCLFTCVNVFALSAQSAILMEANSGRVLMEEDAYQRRGMASTTKVMTAIIAIEQGNLDDMVTVSDRAASVEGSSMWLKPGEVISLESLLYGLMLNSGNDAATAIAEHVGGSEEAFAQLMNEKVRQLGLKDTSFANPHGLDHENHYTTAYDLAQITRYALQNEQFAKIVSTQTQAVDLDGNARGRVLKNHNKMLTLYDSADGVKTGFTKKSGRCLVSSATRDGLQLIAVTLNAPDDWKDHTEMLNYGFSRYTKQTIVTKGDYVCTVPIHHGTTNTLSTHAADTLVVAVASGEEDKVTTHLNVPSFLNAPVFAEQVVGTLEVQVGGVSMGKVDVLATVGVEKEVEIAYWDKLNYLVRELLSNFVKCI